MPAVFIHGNPETSALWDPLFDALNRDDLIALDPPGFGAPSPPGWTATRSEYVAWLAAELGAIEGPIDLVGHDWGGGHVLGVVLETEVQLRSWCVDVIGILHPDYVWHDMAQVWQTEGAGEENVAGMAATPVAEMTAMCEALGMGAAVAAKVAPHVNEDMAAAILGLYRSAAQPALAELGRTIDRAAKVPGLMINAEEDHFVGTDAQAQQMATQAGAHVAHMSGVGHWWMCQDPTAAAAVLEEFWASV